MPNTFGPPNSPTELIDPTWVRQNRRRFRRDALPQIDRANSFAMTGGRYPCVGWVLVSRASMDDIQGADKYARDFQLQIDDFVGPPIILEGLSIVQSRCVTTGLAGDADAVYLVELTDNRGVLCSPWFEYPTNSYYNVLSPAYPGDWYANSLNGGLPWSWDGMIGNLWTQMSGFLGAYPGLPIVPASQPTNWILPGVPAYPALCRMLSLIGCRVAVDLTSATPYTITQDGASDAAFNALTTLYAGRLEDDQEYIDVGSGRVPGTLSVCFHRVNQYYGTEETVRRDSLQWETGAVYSVPVAAPAEFSGATGTGLLWDDFCLRYDVDGNPIAADVASANTIAANRAQQFFDRIYAGTQGYMRRVYGGCVPFVVGSRVDGVLYRQDFRDVRRAGWQTEIVRGPTPPFGEAS